MYVILTAPGCRTTGLPDHGLPATGLPDHGLPDHGLPDHGLPATGLPVSADFSLYLSTGFTLFITAGKAQDAPEPIRNNENHPHIRYPR